MHSKPHHKIGAAANIPINAQQTVVSVSPIVVPCPGRLVDLELRVTFPVSGDALPIVIFSHGQAPGYYLSSLEGYLPLVEFWAAHGFAVLSPTHLSSTILGLKAPPGEKMFMLRERVADIGRILDNFDTIASAVPGLAGRLDYTKVAVAGHSGGGLTTFMALGASNTDPRDGFKLHQPDKRIKAGIIMGSPGRGGDALNESGKRGLPFYDPDFSTMTTPALVVVGDEDDMSGLTDCGAMWTADPYLLSSGPKDLLTVKGGKHGFGGVGSWDDGDDSSPQRLIMVQRVTWAYLQSQFYEGDTAWEAACKALETPDLEGEAKVDHKE